MSDPRYLIENVLRMSEVCVCAYDVKKVKDNGRRNPRVLGVVTSKEYPVEHAVLVIKTTKFGRLMVSRVFPIQKDFAFRLKNEIMFSVSKVHIAEETYEGVSPAEVSALISVMQNSHITAIRENYEHGGMSHTWCAHYIDAAAKKRRHKKNLTAFAGSEMSDSMGLSPGPLSKLSTSGDTEYDQSMRDAMSDVPRLSSGTGLATPGGDTFPQSVTSSFLESPRSSKMASPLNQPGISGTPGSTAGASSSQERLMGEMTKTVNAINRRSGAKYNTTLFSYVRDDWIKKQLHLRTSEFHDVQEMKMIVGTWNVNGKRPGEDMSEWLMPEMNCDIYVAGFQEIVDLTASALLLDDISNKAHAQWVEHLDAMFIKYSGVEYVRVTSRHLVGVLVGVWVKKEHLDHVSDIKTDVAGVGLMGVMGNKGGVAVRFRFYNQTIAFVSGHLAASQKHVERRNDDYMDIMRRISFKEDGQTIGILDHDTVVWLGDFNYRLDMPYNEVREKIAEEDWDYLLSADQLCIQRSLGKAFVPFSEGPINFPPTYKYDPGTNIFDTSEKQRTPAWCDRVLWRGSAISQLFYKRAPLLTSDHKPVYALFDLKVKTVNPEKMTNVYQDIMRTLDAWENECLPQITIGSNVVDFGEVFYDTPNRQTISVANTGQVVVRFRFVAKLEDKEVCKRWLSVQPTCGMIIPGESQDIRICVNIDPSSATALNCETDTLDDTLILRLENGRDYFLSVVGDYQRTCFGTPLEQLAVWVDPVRESMCPKKPESSMAVPKEMWRMIDYIYQNGLHEEGLFFKSGDETEIAQIRECLDRGLDFPTNISSVSMASALIAFLEYLPEPVIPFSMYTDCVESCNIPERCRRLADELPRVHRLSLVYIMSFLRELLRQTQNSTTTADSLATIFSSVLLRPPNVQVLMNEGSSQQRLSLPQRRKFIIQLLGVHHNAEVDLMASSLASSTMEIIEEQ